MRPARLLLVAGGLMLSLPEDSTAQTSIRFDMPISVAELLRQFEVETSASVTDAHAEAIVTRAFAWRRDLPAATVDSLLDGLGALAVRAPHGRSRLSAATLLSLAGDRSLQAPVPGTVRRLVAVYESSSDALVRRGLLGLPFSRQTERVAAVRFLGEVAQLLEDSIAPDAPVMALGTLSRMGESGEQELRRLHERGLVSNPRARALLFELAGRDFKLKPVQRE